MRHLDSPVEVNINDSWVEGRLREWVWTAHHSPQGFVEFDDQDAVTSGWFEQSALRAHDVAGGSRPD